MEYTKRTVTTWIPERFSGMYQLHYLFNENFVYIDTMVAENKTDGVLYNISTDVRNRLFVDEISAQTWVDFFRGLLIKHDLAHLVVSIEIQDNV
jgi:hypothetical protein